MDKQLLAVNEVINDVRIASEDKKHNRFLFIWGKGMWEQIWMPEHECNPNGLKLAKNDTGRLVQVQGIHYKTYEFIPHRC